jgi:septal ring factor EnvC (AmiA/AmiB activator)
MDMASGIMGEVRRSPYTSVTALACLIGMPFIYTLKADAGDVRALQQQIAEVRETVRRESAQGELNNVRRELFDITLRINTLERERINVDELLYRRRDELTAAQRRLEAKLQAMDAKE